MQGAVIVQGAVIAMAKVRTDFWIGLFCLLLDCCAVLCCAVLCCAVLCRAVLHHTTVEACGQVLYTDSGSKARPLVPATGVLAAQACIISACSCCCLHNNPGLWHR